MISGAARAGIDLYWLPLGAGGRFVRFNGRVYELLHAFLERRPPLDLYHSALEVTVAEGRFVIENSWPIPNLDAAARGVTVEGPVASRYLGRFRTFRYEVRRWRDGTIADAQEAVASPQRVSDDEAQARLVLASQARTRFQQPRARHSGAESERRAVWAEARQSSNALRPPRSDFDDSGGLQIHPL